MEKVLHDQVTAIARSVRDWVQAKADRSDYNPDDLNGWCAIASAELFKRLMNEGIQTKLVLTNGDYECHAFVIVDDYIVDVTATQFRPFRNKEIVIIHEKDGQQHDFYRYTDEFASGKELRKHQLKNRWPREQIAYAK